MLSALLLTGFALLVVGVPCSCCIYRRSKRVRNHVNQVEMDRVQNEGIPSGGKERIVQTPNVEAKEGYCSSARGKPEHAEKIDDSDEPPPEAFA